MKNVDQFRSLGNCSPTPPLTQHYGLQKNFSPLWASVWSKSKGVRGGGGLGPSLGSATEQSYSGLHSPGQSYSTYL